MDRTVYELQVLARILEYGASYDQLNIFNLVCFEVISRRIQLLIDANSRDPGAPVFEDDDVWSGGTQRAGGIAPHLSAHVASRIKDKAEVEKQRQKAKEALKNIPADPPTRQGGRRGNRN